MRVGNGTSQDEMADFFARKRGRFILYLLSEKWPCHFSENIAQPPRPSNVTGGLLFDLGFYHYGYLYFL